MKSHFFGILALGLCVLSVPALAQPGESCNCKSQPQQVAAMEKDVVATATSAGKFKTLLTAVKAAGLVKTLQGPGPFTVFAPTDEAFAKLPKGALESLLKDKTKLTAVLTYHVVSGNLSAKDVLGGAALKSLQGETIKATNTGGVAKVDQAKIVTTDIKCSNGVIHIIDAVLMPK